MREIKFRAWHTRRQQDHPQMEYDVQDSSDNNSHLVVYPSLGCYIAYERFGDCHLMQYTGMKDKNGKEIYEGDILDYTDFYGPHRVVVEDIRWTFYAEREGDGDFCKKVVVGNIYENPELMEVETKGRDKGER